MSGPGSSSEKPSTEKYRTQVRGYLLNFILKKEQTLGKTPSSSEIEEFRTSVKEWEERCFQQTKGNSTDYAARVVSKKEQMVKAFQLLNPPLPSVPPAPKPTTLVPPNPAQRDLIHRLLHEVRDPLSHCRLMLHMIHPILLDPRDVLLKDEYLRIYTRLSELQTHVRETREELTKLVATLSLDVKNLCANLEPRIEALCDHLHMDRYELGDMQEKPFHLLMRDIQLWGADKYVEKAKRVSLCIGGRACLKLPKRIEE